MKNLFVFFILAILLVGCTTSNPTAAPSTRPAVTDPATPIEVQAGETFNIVIDDNPSTGYHWEFTDELDGNIVEFVSRDYTVDEPVMPGSGGVDIWIFKALSAGQAQIALGSFPPGADDGEAAQTVTFNIIVK
jgi:inhibitor of cysteine peptidase